MARKSDPRFEALLLASVLAAAGSTVPSTADASSRPDPEAAPVLVELFTSEGCSSCPPADALLAELAALPAVEGARVVPLGYHVTYWDRLGWRDRFSDPAWTARQEDYARALGEASVYTPQAIVDGRIALVGSRERGENAARRLRHVAVVRLREELGTVAAARGPIRLPTISLQLAADWDLEALDLVAVVQRRGPGPVVAIATRPVRERGPGTAQQ